MREPNIVFIMADDMGWGDLSCFGAMKIQTPNMDRVAAEGIRFVDAHSSSAVCTPSRYSVLTGRYCWRSRLERWVLGGFGAPIIEEGRLTVASLLRQHGYATAAIGKWHLGLDWHARDGRPLEETDWTGWVDGFDVDYARPFERGPRSLGFDTFFGIAGSLDMPPYCFLDGDRPAEVPTREKQRYEAQQRRGLMAEGWRDDLVDVSFADRAVRFMEEHARRSADRPFLLYLTPSAPHRPCIPPELALHKSQAGARGDMVVTVDWLVGQVCDCLSGLGLRENTLLMVTSDNGARLTDVDGKDWGHRPNGSFRGQKADIWDGGHREPLVAMWPAVIRPGRVSEETVCLADLLGTCADIVGARLPRGAGEDSASLYPLLRGDTLEGPLHEAIVHHSGDGMFSIRKGPWKLIQGTGSGGFTEPARYTPADGAPQGQLYNVVDDHRETFNHWSGRPEVVRELTALLGRYRQEGRSVGE